TGSTEKLGVRSSWKGQRPVKRELDARRRDVRAETTSTMSAATLTSATLASLIRATGATLLGAEGGGVLEREPVGHARQVVGHARRELPVSRRQTLRLADERVEDRAHHAPRPLVFRHHVRAEIDVLEHEGAEREHGFPHVVALDDVAGGLGGLDEIVDERVDPLRARGAEELDLVEGKVALGQDAVPERVVDVVVDVGDAVDDADDLAFVRRRLALARVGEDAVADLVRQVELSRDPQRLLVVE